MASRLKPVNENLGSRVETISSSQELTKSLASNELVFGIVGHVGSGTSTAAESLRDILETAGSGDARRNVSILKARDVIASWANHHGEQLPAETDPKMKQVERYQDLGDLMRKNGDHAAVARGLIRNIRMRRAELQSTPLDETKPVVPDGSPRAYILDSIRHPAEVYLLRRAYGEAFVLVGVVCEQAVRAERISKKYRDAGLDDAEKFMRRDAKAGEKHGQRVSDAFHLSDYFVDNTASRFIGGDARKPNPKWDIPDHLERLVRLVTHLQIERPKIEETAMHAAGGAAMRSSCLSRQVGAALLDRNGNIVATGENEVPRAGGGVYGEESDNSSGDYRCFVDRKFCSNTTEQNEISEELADHLTTLFDGNANREQLVEALRSSRVGELLEFSRAVHAEMDAVLEAGRKGVSTVGCRVFVTTFPCHYCARHLVSAGVDEVQFIEPYPKSKAIKLHGDSIQLDDSDGTWERPSVNGGGKVLFRPFTGVAPRMYRRAFQKSRELKNSLTGHLQIHEPEWGSPYDIAKSSYAEFEVSLTKGFGY